MPKKINGDKDHDYEMVDMFLNREKSRWTIILKEATAKTFLTYTIAVSLLILAFGLLYFFISLSIWFDSDKSKMPETVNIKSDKEIIIKNANIEGVKSINIKSATILEKNTIENKINDEIGLIDITNKNTINKKNINDNNTITNVENCAGIAKAGDSKPRKFKMNVLENSGILTLNYNTYKIPDNISIRYEGNIIYETGCTGSGKMKRVDIPYNGKDKSFIIDVIPNCDGTIKDTSWNFELKC